MGIAANTFRVKRLLLHRITWHKQMDQQTHTVSNLSSYQRDCFPYASQSQVYYSKPRSVITTPSTITASLVFPSDISVDQYPDSWFRHVCFVPPWTTCSTAYYSFSQFLQLLKWPLKPNFPSSYSVSWHFPTHNIWLSFLPLLNIRKMQVKEIEWMETQGNNEVWEQHLEVRLSSG